MLHYYNILTDKGWTTGVHEFAIVATYAKGTPHETKATSEKFQVENLADPCGDGYEFTFESSDNFDWSGDFDVLDAKYENDDDDKGLVS